MATRLSEVELSNVGAIRDKLTRKLHGETHSDGSKHGIFLPMPDWALLVRAMDALQPLPERSFTAPYGELFKHLHDCAGGCPYCVELVERATP